MIRDEASRLLGIHIPKGGWSAKLNELDMVGKLSQRQMIDLLILLLSHMEVLEDEKRPEPHHR